jgi:hypothetical protein
MVNNQTFCCKPDCNRHLKAREEKTKPGNRTRPASSWVLHQLAYNGTKLFGVQAIMFFRFISLQEQNSNPLVDVCSITCIA